MKIFRNDQIKAIDQFTIENEPVSSTDLMERAAGKIYDWIISQNFSNPEVIILAGPGNNGGDGLVLARRLYLSSYKCKVWYVHVSDSNSADWKVNRKRLADETTVEFRTIEKMSDLPEIPDGAIIIDALFGSGLSKPVTGLAAGIIDKVNQSNANIIAIDIPSGLAGEDNSMNDKTHIIRAHHTLSFEFPRLAFMFPENEQFTGDWTVLPIGLHPEIIENTPSQYHYLEEKDIASRIKKRNKFAHKGVFGHGLLIGGSKGKMGAVVLGSKAAMRAGTGLLTCHIPADGNSILQSSVPEVMTLSDGSSDIISNINDSNNYDAVAVGPGIGTRPETQQALFSLLSEIRKPLVIDADALNILALNKKWMKLLNRGTILTPHPKEFERITGKITSGYKRLVLLGESSRKYGCIIILKGACTSIATPEGQVFFNSTGNPGMATAGSGDVLTGVILSLLAQGYSSNDAAIIGVYLHGLAGDLASAVLSEESLIASDIIDYLGLAYNKIKGHKLI